MNILALLFAVTVSCMRPSHRYSVAEPAEFEVSAGYVDNSCCPESVYCIYNALTCPKTMFDKVENGHGDGFGAVGGSDAGEDRCVSGASVMQFG